MITSSVSSSTTASQQHYRHGTPQPSSSISVDMADLEPDDAWKANLQREIQANTELLIKAARDEFESAIRTIPHKRQMLEAEFYKNTQKAEAMAREDYEKRVEKERQERRWTAGLEVDQVWKDIIEREQASISRAIEMENKASKAGATGSSDHTQEQQQYHQPQYPQPPPPTLASSMSPSPMPRSRSTMPRAFSSSSSFDNPNAVLPPDLLPPPSSAPATTPGPQTGGLGNSAEALWVPTSASRGTPASWGRSSSNPIPSGTPRRDQHYPADQGMPPPSPASRPSYSGRPSQPAPTNEQRSSFSRETAREGRKARPAPIDPTPDGAGMSDMDGGIPPPPVFHSKSPPPSKLSPWASSASPSPGPGSRGISPSPAPQAIPRPATASPFAQMHQQQQHQASPPTGSSYSPSTSPQHFWKPPVVPPSPSSPMDNNENPLSSVQTNHTGTSTTSTSSSTSKPFSPSLSQGSLGRRGSSASMRSIASTNSMRSIGSATSMTSLRSSVSGLGRGVAGDTILEGESDGDECRDREEQVVGTDDERENLERGNWRYDHEDEEENYAQDERDRRAIRPGDYHRREGSVRRKNKDRSFSNPEPSHDYYSSTRRRPDAPFPDNEDEEERRTRSIIEASNREVKAQKERMLGVEKSWEYMDKERSQTLPTIPVLPLGHSSSAESRNSSGKVKSKSLSASTSSKPHKLNKSSTAPALDSGDFDEGYMRNGSAVGAGDFTLGEFDREQPEMRGYDYDPGLGRSQGQSKTMRSALSSSVSSNPNSASSTKHLGGIPITAQPTLLVDDFDMRSQGYFPSQASPSGGPPLSTSASSGSKVKRSKSVSRKASFVEPPAQQPSGYEGAPMPPSSMKNPALGTTKKKGSVDFDMDNTMSQQGYFAGDSHYVPEGGSVRRKKKKPRGGSGTWEEFDMDDGTWEREYDQQQHQRRRESNSRKGSAYDEFEHSEYQTPLGGMRGPPQSLFDSQDEVRPPMMHPDLAPGYPYVNMTGYGRKPERAGTAIGQRRNSQRGGKSGGARMDAGGYADRGMSGGGYSRRREYEDESTDEEYGKVPGEPPQVWNPITQSAEPYRGQPQRTSSLNNGLYGIPPPPRQDYPPEPRRRSAAWADDSGDDRENGHAQGAYGSPEPEESYEYEYNAKVSRKCSDGGERRRGRGGAPGPSTRGRQPAQGYRQPPVAAPRRQQSRSRRPQESDNEYGNPRDDDDEASGSGDGEEDGDEEGEEESSEDQAPPARTRGPLKSGSSATRRQQQPVVPAPALMARAPSGGAGKLSQMDDVSGLNGGPDGYYRSRGGSTRAKDQAAIDFELAERKRQAEEEAAAARERELKIQWEKEKEQERMLREKWEREEKEQEKEKERERARLKQEEHERREKDREEKELRARFEREQREMWRQQLEEEERNKREKAEREQREREEQEQKEKEEEEIRERERERREREEREDREAREREEQAREKLREIEEAMKKAEDEARRWQEKAASSMEQAEEFKRKREEAERLVRDAQQKHREAERKHAEAVRLANVVKEKEKEARRKELENFKKEKELRQREAELKRREEDIQRAEEQRRMEEELRQKEEELKREEEAEAEEKRRADELAAAAEFAAEQQRRANDLAAERQMLEEQAQLHERARQEAELQMRRAKEGPPLEEIKEEVEEQAPLFFEEEREPAKKVKGSKGKKGKAKKKGRVSLEEEEESRAEREKQEEQERQREQQEQAALMEEKERLHREAEEEERARRLKAKRRQERRKSMETKKEEEERERQREEEERERQWQEEHGQEEVAADEDMDMEKVLEAEEAEKRRRMELELEKQKEQEERDRAIKESIRKMQEEERLERVRKEQEEAARRFQEWEERKSKQEQGEKAKREAEINQQAEYQKKGDEVRRKRQDSGGSEGAWQPPPSIPFSANLYTRAGTPRSPPTARPPSTPFPSERPGAPPAWSSWGVPNATPNASSSAWSKNMAGGGSTFGNPPRPATTSPNKSRAGSMGSSSGPTETEWAQKQAEFLRQQQERFQQEQQRAARQTFFAQETPLSGEDMARMFERNDQAWRKLLTTDGLRWEDFPWPMIRRPSNPDDITTSAIEAYILSPHYPDKSRSEKDRIKDFIKRWHPDRFETKLLIKVLEEEKEKVREGAGSVVRSLNDLLAKRNDTPQDWFGS